MSIEELTKEQLRSSNMSRFLVTMSLPAAIHRIAPLNINTNKNQILVVEIFSKVFVVPCACAIPSNPILPVLVPWL